VVKIGAQDEGIQKALEKLGVQAKSVEADLSKLGKTPIGEAAKKSIEALQATMQKVTDAQQRVADRAVAAAQGFEVFGGKAKFAAADLASFNSIAVKGIDAFQALGKEVPASLTKMAEATKKVTTSGGGFTSFLGQANGLLATFGVSLSIGAVVGFGKELLRMGDEIQRVSDRTGLSTKEVQEFSYVAGQSGNSIEELTSALGQMQNRLVSGDKGAVGAVKALGINLDQLMASSPADQMELIATAIGKIPDPAQRTAAAMDLFGKSGAAILPTLTANFAALRKEAPAMSDATVKALDQAGDALARFGTQIKVWAAESYNFAGQGFDALTKAAFNAIAKMRELTIAVLKIVENIPGASKAFSALGINIDKLSESAQWYRDAAKAMDVRTESVGKTAAATVPKLKLYNAATEKAAKETEKAAEKFDLLTDKVHGLEAGLAAVPDALQKIGKGYDESKLAPLTAAVVKVEQSAHIAAFGFKGMTDSLKDVGTTATKTLDELDGFARFEFSGPINQVESFGKTMRKVFEGIPGMVAQAFTGGGGILGALKGIGSQIGSTLGEKLGKSITSLGALAGPLGAAVGSLAGPLVGMFSKMFSSAEKQINPLRQTFVDMAGGLDALNRKAAAAGVTLTAMLNAKNPEAYKKAIEDLNTAFQFQADALAVLDETAKRYGFTIEELGPAMARQELDKQAQGLFKDWQVLNAAGIDTVAITSRMAESVNAYVKTATKMGVEVPAAMKPMLQAMIDQGLLTDAAGNKIENLEDSGITFAQTMSEGFKSVVDEVKKLAEAITRSLGGAISGLPTQKKISIDFETGPVTIPGGNRERDFAARGGLVTETGIQRFASGGRVLPFLRRGTDTVPAMLTPGEIVLNEAQQQAVGQAMGGGGVDLSGLRLDLAGLRSDLARDRADAPRRNARALTAALQTAGLRK
jgi:hypothetical protein